MSVVIAIDAGTTGVRAVGVDESGAIIASSYSEFTQHFPQPGWVEHDADEIWSTTLGVLGEVSAAIDQPVAAIGITDQRETVVAWSQRSGDPLHRAIVWQDRRTAEACEQLEAAGHLPLIREKTGLVLDPYFSASKMRWLLDGPVGRGSDVRLGTIDSWLVHKLSRHSTHATDVTNASRTMLYDIGSGEWSDELTELFDVPPSALAEVVPSSGRIATVAADMPVAAGTPISGIAGDQQAALFGQACFEPGTAKNTYGTGSFLLFNVGAERPASPDGLLTTIAWQLGDGPLIYALEGAAFVTGSAIQWLRDGLGIIEDAAEVGPLAESVSDSGGVVIVPAFTGLGSPWWDPHARGTIVGLTRGTGRAELARAVVDSIAHQCADIADAMVSATGAPLREVRVDGGASVMDGLLQLQADLFGSPVLRSEHAESTALGSAFLAGLAEGVWSSTDEIADLWRSTGRFEPQRDSAELAPERARWHDAVDRSRNWAAD